MADPKITERPDGFYEVEGLDGYYQKADAERVAAQLGTAKRAAEAEEAAAGEDGDEEGDEDDEDDEDDGGPTADEVMAKLEAIDAKLDALITQIAPEEAEQKKPEEQKPHE